MGIDQGFIFPTEKAAPARYVESEAELESPESLVLERNRNHI